MRHSQFSRKLTDPLRPPFVGMTDRADGTVWWMIHKQAENRWGITDVVPGPGRWATNKKIFPAFEGPLLTTRTHCLRMLLRNRRLGYELAEMRGDNPPVRTRIVNFQYFLKLHDKEFEQFGDTLSYLVETSV